MKTKLSIVVLLGLLICSGLLFGGAGKNADPIKFSHGLHAVDAGAECTDCHDGINGVAAGERLMPDHDVCLTCHDQVEDENECGYCHAVADDPMPHPKAYAVYTGFAHGTHSHKVTDCAMCHGKVADNAAYEPLIPDLPDCQMCHTAMEIEPQNHEMLSWHLDHGLESAFMSHGDENDCSICHSQQSCDACHQGHMVTGGGTAHPPTWLRGHFAETNYGHECLVCHESRDYCTSCHRASVPRPHILGPAYANETTGGEHVDDFKAFPESCISCHDRDESEPTCAKCHQ